jgi:hypothetical protein
MTVFVDITGAIIAALTAEPAVSSNIFRARDAALLASYATAVNVQWDAGTPDYGQVQGAPADWQSKYTIECYAKSSTLSGDLAVDPLLDAVFERLAADPTLGGMVAWLRMVHVEASCDSAGQKTGWVGMTYLVTHRTSADNLNA